MNTNGKNGTEQQQNFTRRYLELAKTGKLPPDKQVAILIGCAHNTPAALRSAMKRNGWHFVANGNGYDAEFLVVAPHEQTDTNGTVPAAPPDTTAVNMIDVLRQEFARQNIAVNELAQMVAELVQLQRATLEVIKQVWQ